jgi:O-antigen/teichoic acid export membrane protein
VLPLILLLPGIVAWGAGRILSQFISYNAGRPSLTSGAAAMGFAVNLLANIYAMPRWGLAGAAAASSVSYLATMAFVGITFMRLGRRLGTSKCA